MSSQRNYRLRLKKTFSWKTYEGVCFHELNPATSVLRIQQLDGTLHIIFGRNLEITLFPEFMEQEIKAKLEEAEAKKDQEPQGKVVETDNIIEDELSPEEVAIEVQKAEEGLERWRMAQRNLTPLVGSNEVLSAETTNTLDS